MAKTSRVKGRAIVRGYLEKISANVFDRYRDQITGLVGSHQGVYALYKRDKLYYIGLATDLKRRIRHHLRDRHRGKWTHFSLYVIRREEHIREIESILVRIANPSGNKVRGRLGKSKNLRPHLRKLVATRIKEEIETLLGPSKQREKKLVKKRAAGRSEKPKDKKSKAAREKRPMKGLFKATKVLYATYKGKSYKARLRKNGTMKFDGNLYYAPTGPAKVITGRAINGWEFWKYKDTSGKIRSISHLRR